MSGQSSLTAVLKNSDLMNAFLFFSSFQRNLASSCGFPTFLLSLLVN